MKVFIVVPNVELTVPIFIVCRVFNKTDGLERSFLTRKYTKNYIKLYKGTCSVRHPEIAIIDIITALKIARNLCNNLDKLFQKTRSSYHHWRVGRTGVSSPQMTDHFFDKQFQHLHLLKRRLSVRKYLARTRRHF